MLSSMAMHAVDDVHVDDHSQPTAARMGIVAGWVIACAAMAALALVPNATLFSSFAIGIVVSVVQALPLAFVRRRPTAAVAVLCAGVVLASAFGSDVRVPWSAASIVVGIVVVIVAAARTSDAGAAARAAAVATAASIAVIRHDMPIGIFTAFIVTLTGLVLVVRLTVRLREASARLREERHLRAVEEVRRAADAERAALSAKVHDVVGHHLVVISLAAASEDRRVSTPAEKDRVLSEIASSAALALAEIRSVLDESAGWASSPGVEDADESVRRLVDEWSNVGVHVEHEGLILVDHADAALQHEAYQIVRQAITNAVQHGPTKAVRIVVTETPEAMRLRVLNEADGRQVVPGCGLSSMRARLEKNGHGLSIRAGDGTFELDAVLSKES